MATHFFENQGNRVKFYVLGCHYVFILKNSPKLGSEDQVTGNDWPWLLYDENKTESADWGKIKWKEGEGNCLLTCHAGDKTTYENLQGYQLCLIEEDVTTDVTLQVMHLDSQKSFHITLT